MAFKKGFCTHCHGDEKMRIFEVNKDADVCYCPYCTHAMRPYEAMDNYNWLISNYLKKASKALFETTDYLYAYQTFAHIIDLDETIKVAYFGRLLALVYLSTLRNGKMSHALLMHRQQARLFHYQETAISYFHFLWLLLDALDQYEVKMKKRLTNHGVFYDTDCVTLFLKRLEEIKNYKEFIANEANFFVESNKEEFSAISNRLKKSQSEYTAIFKQKYIVADGNSYAFEGLDKNDNPIVNLCKPVPQQKLHHTKPANLYTKENKKSPIRDDVYLNNATLSRLVSISVPVAIILLLVVIGGIIASFINDDQTIKLMIYIIGAVLLSASMLLVILHFAWKNRLKKKYYNGTNPFTLK